jgi:hypothetical protein
VVIGLHLELGHIVPEKNLVDLAQPVEVIDLLFQQKGLVRIVLQQQMGMIFNGLQTEITANGYSHQQNEKMPEATADFLPNRDIVADHSAILPWLFP